MGRVLLKDVYGINWHCRRISLCSSSALGPLFRLMESVKNEAGLAVEQRAVASLTTWRCCVLA